MPMTSLETNMIGWRSKEIVRHAFWFILCKSTLKYDEIEGINKTRELSYVDFLFALLTMFVSII